MSLLEATKGCFEAGTDRWKREEPHERVEASDDDDDVPRWQVRSSSASCGEVSFIFALLPKRQKLSDPL